MVTVSQQANSFNSANHHRLRGIGLTSAELREALGAAGAAALVQKIIDPVLLEYQRRYSPLVRAIPSGRWGSTTYFFNQRTVNPNGGFVTDGGTRPVTNS